MARNNRAKPKKKRLNVKTRGGKSIKDLSPNEEVFLVTREEYDEILQENARQIFKGAISLLEYNMIIENHLTPEQAAHQSHLMEVRAEAILNGYLTFDEIDEFLDKYHKDGKIDG